MSFIRQFSPQRKIIKFYYDFKSPYSYLALDETLQLRCLPWPFRAEESFGGKLEERKRIHWNKVKYLYLDCRRFANERGLIIRGPEKLFDSRLASIAGLYADQHGFFPRFANKVFQLFFERKLNLEQIDAIQKEAEEDQIFGESVKLLTIKSLNVDLCIAFVWIDLSEVSSKE